MVKENLVDPDHVRNLLDRREKNYKESLRQRLELVKKDLGRIVKLIIKKYNPGKIYQWRSLFHTESIRKKGRLVYERPFCLWSWIKLWRRGPERQPEQLEEEQASYFQTVDVNSLEVESPRSIGAEYLCHSVWKELGMEEFGVPRWGFIAWNST